MKNFHKLIPIGVIAGLAGIAQYGSLIFIEEAVMIAFKEMTLFFVVVGEAWYNKQKIETHTKFAIFFITLGAFAMALPNSFFGL